MNEILKNVFRFLIQETNNSNQMDFILFIILCFFSLFSIPLISLIIHKISEHIFKILRGDNEDE